MVYSEIMGMDILIFHRRSQTTVLSGSQYRAEDHRSVREEFRSEEVGDNLPILRDQANLLAQDQLKRLKSKLGYSSGAHRKR